MVNTDKQHSKIFLADANVITMDPSKPRAECVAICGQSISFVGSKKAFENLEIRGFEVIDCGGRTILPGFIDAHCHLHAFAESLVTLDLRATEGFSSIANIKAAIRNLSQKIAPGTWIRGRGYNEFYLAEKRHPTRWDLDEVAPNHPVKLTHRTGHAHVLNSLALQAVNVSIETPDPSGALIDRDNNTGEPTGLLYEMSQYLSERIPPLDHQSFLAGVKLANEQLLRSGVTSVQDASYLNGFDQWKEFHSWKKDGLFRPRIGMMLGSKLPDPNETEQYRTGMVADDPRITGVKIILDETPGELHPAQSGLNEIVLKAHQKGFQVAIHAIEKPAVESACYAIENATQLFPKADHRHRIEHCSVCDPVLAKCLASQGIMVVTQPAFIYYNGDRYLRTVPREHLSYLYPLKTFLGNGVRVAASSDFPIDPPNPLIGFYSAVARRSKTGKVLSEEQAIPPWTALRMYTHEAARAGFDEGLRGTLTPGKAADLIMLSDDPTRVTPESIKDIKVEMTVIGGEIVWEDKA
jgi:predicted amidohydrolase YtcJ